MQGWSMEGGLAATGRNGRWKRHDGMHTWHAWLGWEALVLESGMASGCEQGLAWAKGGQLHTGQSL